ncbi:MAG: FkbM family methyltransferase [Verrucomicrobiota bacterium]|jgi:FkbM family methyltransferase|nr:FkbM family methyltransferase [Verrucomicrobiota bacterium]
MNTLLRRLANPRQTLRGALNRLRIKRTKLSLDARCRAAGGTVWSKHHGAWLPYHGDGDQQEIYYQMHGADWLKAETEVVKKWLPKGGSVVDVGANTGFTALVFSNLIGPEGRVIAFEPSPIIYPRLVEVIEKNGLKDRVECLNLGCGTEARTETLMVPVSSGNATIKRDGVELHGSVREVQIKIDSLDTVLLDRLTRLDFLKIDTEGFEDQVLAGAEKVVECFRPVLYIELSQEYSKSSQAAIAWLKTRGYVFEKEPDLNSAHNGDNFIVYPSEKAR